MFSKKKKRVEISAPSNFEHRVHTGYDASEQRFTGLPRQWQGLLEESARRPKPLVDPACITAIRGAHKDREPPLRPFPTPGTSPPHRNPGSFPSDLCPIMCVPNSIPHSPHLHIHPFLSSDVPQLPPHQTSKTLGPSQPGWTPNPGGSRGQFGLWDSPQSSPQPSPLRSAHPAVPRSHSMSSFCCFVGFFFLFLHFPRVFPLPTAHRARLQRAPGWDPRGPGRDAGVAPGRAGGRVRVPLQLAAPGQPPLPLPAPPGQRAGPGSPPPAPRARQEPPRGAGAEPPPVAAAGGAQSCGRAGTPSPAPSPRGPPQVQLGRRGAPAAPAPRAAPALGARPAAPRHCRRSRGGAEDGARTPLPHLPPRRHRPRPGGQCPGRAAPGTPPGGDPQRAGPRQRSRCLARPRPPAPQSPGAVSPHPGAPGPARPRPHAHPRGGPPARVPRAVPGGAADGGGPRRPPHVPGQLHQDRRGLHGRGLHRHRARLWQAGGRQEDGPAQAAAAGAALQRGGDHAGPPARERGGDVQQLPGGRRALGGHGVPGGRRADRHRHPHQDVGGADRRRVPLGAARARRAPRPGRHPPRHQERLHPPDARRAGETLRFRLLRPSEQGGATAQVPGGDPVLDGPRAHLPPALRPRGGHLVSGGDGHRDGGRGAPLFQRAPPQSHEADPGQPSPPAQERPQGVPVAEGLPGADAGAGPGAAGQRPGAAAPPVPGGGGPPRLHRAPHAAAPAAVRPPQPPPAPPPQQHPQTGAGLGCSWAPQPVLLSWGPQSRGSGGGGCGCHPRDLGVQGLILVPPAFGTHFWGISPFFCFFFYFKPPLFYPPWALGYGPPTSP